MTGFYMFKFMWLAQRRKLVPILTAFHRAAHAEIMWRVQLRIELRRLRRWKKIWDKIKHDTADGKIATMPLATDRKISLGQIPKYAELSGFTKGDFTEEKEEEVKFTEEEKELISHLKRGRYFF